MESKQVKINNLFKNDFKSKDFENSTIADDFTCPYIKECDVHKDKEPIYTSFLGSEKSKVMIVAEAPSSSGGTGIFIGKNFSDIDPSGKSPLHILKEFVERQFNETPYFTDVIKCGVEKQREKKMLQTRVASCQTRYLLEEIRIIQPELIICVGNTAFVSVSFLKKNEPNFKSIKVVKIIHYSRQAGLPLNDDDKKLIWKIQTGLIKSEELQNISLKELSYIKSLLC